MVCIYIEDSSFLYKNPNDVHSSSCVLNYYQLDEDSTSKAMLLALLLQIIDASCFDELR